MKTLASSSQHEEVNWALIASEARMIAMHYAGIHENCTQNHGSIIAGIRIGSPYHPFIERCLQLPNPPNRDELLLFMDSLCDLFPGNSNAQKKSAPAPHIKNASGTHHLIISGTNAIPEQSKENSAR
jgi:hypothetical protein